METLDLAKVVLQQALEVAENNAPINEAEGSLAQAQLERKVAEGTRQAIAIIDTELFAYEKQMGDRKSAYWVDEKQQEKYRQLVEKKNTLLSK